MQRPGRVPRRSTAPCKRACANCDEKIPSRGASTCLDGCGRLCAECDLEMHERMGRKRAAHRRVYSAIEGVAVLRSGPGTRAACSSIVSALCSAGEWKSDPDSVDGQPEYQSDLYDCRAALDAVRALDRKTLSPVLARMFPSKHPLRLVGHFVRRYEPGQRVSFRPHQDSSSITVNVLLSPHNAFSGCDLVAYSTQESKHIAELLKDERADAARKLEDNFGLIRVPAQKANDDANAPPSPTLCFAFEEAKSVSHKHSNTKGDTADRSPKPTPARAKKVKVPPALASRTVHSEQGDAVIHSGDIYHGVTSLERGTRHALILFYSSSKQ